MNYVRSVLICFDGHQVEIKHYCDNSIVIEDSKSFGRQTRIGPEITSYIMDYTRAVQSCHNGEEEDELYKPKGLKEVLVDIINQQAAKIKELEVLLKDPERSVKQSLVNVLNAIKVKRINEEKEKLMRAIAFLDSL